MNSSQLFYDLAMVLSDGSDMLKQEGTYIGAAVGVVKSAATGIIGLGGNVMGYIGSGAQYLTGAAGTGSGQNNQNEMNQNMAGGSSN